MIHQQTKDYAKRLIDEGAWFKLLLLILQFGKELLTFINEYKKSKKDESNKNKPVQS